MVLRLLLLAITAVVAQSSGISQEYCATQNTAVNYTGVYNQYQSNGACKTQCQASYAYGIVQGSFCWCSDYTPSSTTDVSQCSDKCPGYPSDLCGNVASNLFGYIALTIAPISIVAAAKTTSSASSSSTTSSSTSQPQAETSTTSATSSSSTPTVWTSAVVVTVSGAVITQTVTSSPISSAAQDAGQYTVQQNGLSTGAIAGIVIGVVAGLLALLLAVFLLYRRKQQQEKEEAVAAAAAGRAMAEKKPPPKRNTSVLSRSGLLGAAYEGEGNPFDEPTGTASQRASMLFGGAVAAEAASPLGSSHSDNSRRHSKPMVYDQRLNPSALFGAHDNSSRVSMQDGADYSRTLGVTNPDPRVSWESRLSR